MFIFAKRSNSAPNTVWRISLVVFYTSSIQNGCLRTMTFFDVQSCVQNVILVSDRHTQNGRNFVLNEGLSVMCHNILLQVCVFICEVEQQTNKQHWKHRGSVEKAFVSSQNLIFVPVLNLDWHFAMLSINCREQKRIQRTVNAWWFPSNFSLGSDARL